MRHHADHEQRRPSGGLAGLHRLRIYTEMGNDRMVVGIRGDHLDQFAKKLSRIAHANEWVKVEDSRRKRESSHSFHRAAR